MRPRGSATTERCRRTPSVPDEAVGAAVAHEVAGARRCRRSSAARRTRITRRAVAIQSQPPSLSASPKTGSRSGAGAPRGTSTRPEREEGQAVGGADPQHALRVLEQRVHVVGGQAVADAARRPARPPTSAPRPGRRPHPHRAVARCRASALTLFEGRPLAVVKVVKRPSLQAAQPAAERARPDAAVAALVHRVDARSAARPVGLRTSLRAAASRPRGAGASGRRAGGRATGRRVLAAIE